MVMGTNKSNTLAYIQCEWNVNKNCFNVLEADIHLLALLKHECWILKLFFKNTCICLIW